MNQPPQRLFWSHPPTRPLKNWDPEYSKHEHNWLNTEKGRLFKEGQYRLKDGRIVIRDSSLLSGTILPPRHSQWPDHTGSHSRKISLYPSTIHHTLCYLWAMHALHQKQSTPGAQPTIRHPEYWNHPIRKHPNGLFRASLGRWKQVSTSMCLHLFWLGGSFPDPNWKSPRSGPASPKGNPSVLWHPSHHRICLCGWGCASPITGSEYELEVAHGLPHSELRQGRMHEPDFKTK
jgi:hypothetical protein